VVLVPVSIRFTTALRTTALTLLAAQLRHLSGAGQRGAARRRSGTR
jgi:hypothetical protein